MTAPGAPVKQAQKAPETPQKQSSAKMTAPGAPVKQAPKAPETPQKQSSAKMTAPGEPVKQKQVESCEFKVGDVVEAPGRYGFGIVTQITGNEVWGDFSGIKGDRWSWNCKTNKMVIKTTEKTPQEVANMIGDWYWKVGDYNKEIREKLGLEKVL